MSDAGRDRDGGRGEKDEQDGQDGQNGGSQGANGREGQEQERGQEQARDQKQGEVETVERVVTVVSVGFTLLLVGFVVWQSVTAPANVQPQVSIVGMETGPNDRAEVTVELINEGSVGLASATVELDCTEPPTELVFDHVPASGSRQGTVVCPPGAADPNATVTGWQEA